ncbi:hypothetical protein RB195_011316 [Necator americanus]|uniref:AAA+ ATPase domain-containing protein n=1 Tax=Necator americanus TaxID=51031 RepID=A0ABR1D2P2_NECAM
MRVYLTAVRTLTMYGWETRAAPSTVMENLDWMEEKLLKRLPLLANECSQIKAEKATWTKRKLVKEDLRRIGIDRTVEARCIVPQNMMVDFFSVGARVKGDEPKSAVDDRARIPWVEKYRPRSVDDLVYQNEVVAVFKKVLEGSDLPNMLLYGPPGTGKTSAAVALCRQLFPSPELFRDRVLELNASDERGIQVVRTRIKDFAHRAVSKASTPYKIVILDEADAMTEPSLFSFFARLQTFTFFGFCLICNYISRIIDPLTSRCAKFRFKPLPIESQLERLLYICKNEGVEIDEKALTMLVTLCEGDLRRSITYLQSLSCRQNITSDFIFTMTGQVDKKIVDKLFLTCCSSDTDRIVDAVESICRAGYANRSLIDQIYEQLLADDTLKDIQKSAIFEKMAVIEARLLDGADEYIQMMDLLFCIQSHLNS